MRASRLTGLGVALEGAALEELGLGEHGGEGGLEVVRGGGEEVVFQASGLFAGADAGGFVDKGAALEDDSGLVG